MAFCPECGKAVAGETGTTTCASCGHALPVSEKKAAATRFNGTVMMAAPVGAKAHEPANVNASAKNAAVAKPGIAASPAHNKSSGGGRMATGAVTSAHGVGGGGAAQRAMARATMIGAGIAPPAVQPTAVPNVRAVIDVPVSPMPEAPAAPVGYAATQAALPRVDAAPPAHRAQPAPVQPQQPAPAPTYAAQASADDRHENQERYLPGDPMAPQLSAARGHAPRTTFEHDELQVPTDERKWLYWAVCGVVLVSVLVLAIGLF
jgi:hypothetical protein